MPGLTLTQDQWDLIVQNIDTKYNCILVGDFNAYHSNWNCKYTDSNGRRFHNAFETTDFLLHNDNSYIQSWTKLSGQIR